MGILRQLTNYRDQYTDLGTKERGYNSQANNMTPAMKHVQITITREGKCLGEKGFMWPTLAMMRRAMWDITDIRKAHHITKGVT
jgi:hypothetical protein